MKRFKELLEDIKTMGIIWYHGSPAKIDKFSIEYAGQGHDEEGPGLYFSSDAEDALGYSKKINEKGHFYDVELNFKKLLPMKGKAKKREVLQMIEWAKHSDLERFNTNLSNWGYEDDDPTTYTKALNDAVKSCMEGHRLDKNTNVHFNSPVEVFKNIWWEFYKNDPVEFCKNMVILGYDGFIVQKAFTSVKHAIVWNDKIIKIVSEN